MWRPRCAPRIASDTYFGRSLNLFSDMASSSDRKAPGVISVFIGAVLSITLGGLLAGLHLASQPVEVMKTAPKEAPPADKLYYVLGAPGSTAGKSWEAKHDLLSEARSGSVTVTEAELNAWSESTFKQVKLSDAEKGSAFAILAGSPNFRIDGASLHVGLVNTAVFFGSEAPLVLQAQGNFARSGSSWRFVPSEARIGALPLHKIPALLSVLADRFGAAQPPAVVEKVLRDANDIAVRDGALVISLR